MSADPKLWVIITSEYPPQSGGVSDYTHALVHALAEQGMNIHVWTSARSEADSTHEGEHVTVHRLCGRFDLRSLGVLHRALSGLPAGTLILLQYVPHSFGYRAMNVSFALWVWWLGRRRRVWTMFHEVAVAYGTGHRWQDHVIAFVTRLMARLVCCGSTRIFVSIPAWEHLLRDLVPVRVPVTWLPIPSNLPDTPDAAGIEAVRAQFLAGGRTLLVGHFGTFGTHVAPLLAPLLLAVAKQLPSAAVLLLGRGSEEFCTRLVRDHPTLENVVGGVGALPSAHLVNHLAACDLLLQPYPDGISTRRTSAMAGLALGVPTVSNSGHLTEVLWRETGCVALSDDASPEGMILLVRELADDRDARLLLGQRGREVYHERFSLQKTLDVLLAAHKS